MLLNYGVGEPESPLDCKEIQPVHPKGHQSWIFFGRTVCWSWNSNSLATRCKELIHLKRPWCWTRLKAGGEGNDRGWDGWMASLTRWIWVWASSRSWWCAGRPGMLKSLGVTKNWTWLSDWTELNWDKYQNKYSMREKSIRKAMYVYLGVHLGD